MPIILERKATAEDAVFLSLSLEVLRPSRQLPPQREPSSAFQLSLLHYLLSLLHFSR